ncbi:efflux RND transporter permease subunit [Thalassobacillus devorans]|uniref:efflux RND transporter permease subunit n=1 Tax=Thalassobacillus devorans TaxID=279813 RepID=UPI00048B340E|nr:MMPL family transporter [Thalassobacillus devorans]
MRNKFLTNTSERSVLHTITKMVPAVMTALIATALGFISLYTSPVPMIQDFGKMLTIGMIVSFFMGILLLIPILYTRDRFFVSRKKKKSRSKKEGKFDGVLDKLTRKLIKLRWLILILAIVTAALGIWVDKDAGVETDVENFMPQDDPALADIHKLRAIIGTTDQVSIVYQGEDVISPDTMEWVDGVSASLDEEFSEVVDTKSITTAVKQMNEGKLPKNGDWVSHLKDMPEEQVKLLINEEHTQGVINIGIKHMESEPLQEFLNDLKTYLEENEAADVETTITGKSVLDVEMISALTSGRYQMTLLGMGLVFLGLLLIYRHPVKAFIPLIPIILIVGWSGAAMYFLEIDYTPLTATLGALIIGIGTEFTVLIMERYYEERKKGNNSEAAIRISNRKIGKAIFTSALTTIGGFSALLISDFVILSNFGLMTLINISLALFSTVVVMPAILIILDRFVKIKENKEVQMG